MKTNKIKVLHIIETLSKYGGTPNKLLLMSKYLDKSKYEIFVLYFLDNDSLRKELENSGVKVIKINKLFYKTLKDVYKIIKIYDVDIISTHFNRSNIIGTICNLFTRKILIQNEHGIPRGYKAKNNILSKVFVYFFEKITYYLKDGYIINSYTVMKEVQGDINKNISKYFIVQNSIDTDNLLNSSHDHKDLRLDIIRKNKGNEICFGTLGGLINGVRDFITIIKATKIIINNGFKVKLIIAGDGPYKSNIEKEIIKEKLESYVILLGYIDDIETFYNIVDVFIYPVTYTVGIGLALLEAMYYKKPIITFAKGDEREKIIVDNVHGFNIDGVNDLTLSEKMKYFVLNKDLIKMFGNNCNKLVLEQYNEQRIAADIDNIYQKLFNRKIQISK